MKIAIGTRLQDGPWGGGNQAAATLSQYLRGNGHDVGFSLDTPDLDVILLTEPRRTSASSAFNDTDVWAYLAAVNPAAVVVHRVNECDERKKTRWVNRRLMLANRCADHTVFISSWLRDLFSGHGYAGASSSVILNGADRTVFRQGDRAPWSGVGPLKVVTHHWAGNWNKGFDIYHRLDELLGLGDWRGRYEFTYVGRVPPGFAFRHATLLPPLAGDALAEELRRHDVYLTASVNEPAGMHHIEGALCGLPLLYRRSGALPEYCEGFGVGFDESTFESGLLEMRDRFAPLKARMPSYANDARRMCRAYESLFLGLLHDRDRLPASRRRTRVQAYGHRAAGALLDHLMKRLG